MNKLTAPKFARGALALLLAWGLGAGACHAQAGPRAVLAAEAGGTGSKVVATLEEYPAHPEIGQLKNGAPALQFLDAYYQAGRTGSRDQLIKLFAPELQADVGKQFADGNAVKAVFADLGKVEMDAAVAWGPYRVVLVKHGSKANPKQAYPWPHAIACARQCMFVQEPQLVQFASYLLYLTKYGKQQAAAGAGLKLALQPVFGEQAPAPGALADPVELQLVDADAAARAAGAALLARLVKYPDAGPALAEAQRALFDAATPQGYPRKAGSGKATELVAWPAYLERVRGKTWTVAHTFKLRADAAIVLATSADHDVLFLPMRQTGNGWRLFSNASDAPFWPLFEGRPFAEAFGKLLKKPQ